MKTSSPTLPIFAAALLAAALLAAAAVAQSPQTAPSQPSAAGAPPPLPRAYPAPTNLKVLPKNLTGEQVREIMEGWAAALGAHCNTCHVADPNNIGPNGRPRLNFADDSRPEKSTARLMYKMVEDINGNYISMIENSGAGVACGTCHRGHLTPEPFVAPKEDHAGPRPPQGEPPAVGAPRAPSPAGSAPPLTK